MVFIYVLLLETNKYYIGKTSNPDFRIEQHLDCNNSSWTKKYKPLHLLDIKQGDDGDEDKYTLQYMEKYGIDNVRGGSFYETQLSDESKITIHKMITNHLHLLYRCIHCGRTGHYENNCYVLKYIEKVVIVTTMISAMLIIYINIYAYDKMKKFGLF